MRAKGKDPTFEEALKSLEGVVAKLESGETKLEESIRLFEEGMRLSALCQKRLDDADRKIELLLRKPGGVVVNGTEDEADILRDEE
ncbi:MAG TPA: exodeoxyribonuclease VII small subunit [Deltaproteobacteria bacterium]|nr:exodeoxyribonuclease VII small subunit [Deltaproteobacteria bacterium]